MTEQLHHPVSTSVVMFRLRAQRLLFVWTRMWMNHVRQEPVSQEFAELLATAIQTAHWNVLKRNPSIREWVRDILYYIEHPNSRATMEDDLRSLNLPVLNDPLNVLKPWWVWYAAAGRDEQKAMQTFSENVGAAFLTMTGKDAVLSPHVDWTDELNIQDFLENLPKPLKTKGFWTFFRNLRRGA